MTPERLASICVELISNVEFEYANKMTVAGLILARLAASTNSSSTNSTPITATPIKSSGKILITAGSTCYCHACKRDVYNVLSDVYTNMATVEFRACFEPAGHTITFPKVIDILTDDDGNIATDCPLCKGIKSLWLVGRGEPINLTGSVSEGSPDV